MRAFWKEGTEEIGDIGFRSSFYTTNAVNVKKYLELKKRETRIAGSLGCKRKHGHSARSHY